MVKKYRFFCYDKNVTTRKASTLISIMKIPTIKQLNEEYGELLKHKKETYIHYREAKQEITNFATAKYDIERFLNLSQEEEINQEQEKEKEKNKISRYELLGHLSEIIFWQVPPILRADRRKI